MWHRHIFYIYKYVAHILQNVQYEIARENPTRKTDGEIVRSARLNVLKMYIENIHLQYKNNSHLFCSEYCWILCQAHSFNRVLYILARIWVETTRFCTYYGNQKVFFKHCPPPPLDTKSYKQCRLHVRSRIESYRVKKIWYKKNFPLDAMIKPKFWQNIQIVVQRLWLSFSSILTKNSENCYSIKTIFFVHISDALGLSDLSFRPSAFARKQMWFNFRKSRILPGICGFVKGVGWGYSKRQSLKFNILVTNQMGEKRGFNNITESKKTLLFGNDGQRLDGTGFEAILPSRCITPTVTIGEITKDGFCITANENMHRAHTPKTTYFRHLFSPITSGSGRQPLFLLGKILTFFGNRSQKLSV